MTATMNDRTMSLTPEATIAPMAFSARNLVPLMSPKGAERYPGDETRTLDLWFGQDRRSLGRHSLLSSYLDGTAPGTPKRSDPEGDALTSRRASARHGSNLTGLEAAEVNAHETPRVHTAGRPSIRPFGSQGSRSTAR